tara:strand:- start:51 stop:224 length:174 start_codon:yes stop_codon:yes gene_type:complete
MIIPDNNNNLEDLITAYAVAESNPRFAALVGFLYFSGLALLYGGIALVFLFSLLGIL